LARKSFTSSASALTARLLFGARSVDGRVHLSYRSIFGGLFRPKGGQGG
jgi:hypothetical protein